MHSAAVDRHRSVNAITRNVAELDWPSWRSQSRLVQFETGIPASSVGDLSDHLIFPTSCIFSLSGSSPTGRLAEAALVGREGCVGLWLLSQDPPSPISFIPQTKGFGLVIAADFLRREFSSSAAFRRDLLNYAAATVQYAIQTCFCYRHHTIEQQVTKMMLLTLLRTGRDEIDTTHQMIATILGVRREGVSEALTRLQERGFVTQGRGRIRIEQRDVLESTACECYPLLRSHLGYNGHLKLAIPEQIQ